MKKLIIMLFVAASALTVSALFAQDEFEMKDGDTTFIIKKYYMCFLKKGDNRSHDSAEVAKIQAGHLSHMSALAKQGIIMIAGPFGGTSEDGLQGIVIYNVKTKEEAENYTSKDPAVIAGRLRFEVREWWSAKGSALK